MINDPKAEQRRFVMVMAHEVQYIAESMAVEITPTQLSKITEEVIADDSLWEEFNNRVQEIITDYLKRE